MVQEFLEALEILPQGSLLEAEFVRIEITGMAYVDVQVVQSQIEAVMEGKSYRLSKHICHHDVTPPQSCVTELIKEVL